MCNGEFANVRTFAEQLKHIAADNYLLGAGILGEKTPVEVGAGESGLSAARSKPEIIAYLKASFAHMHRAAASIDDAKAPIPTPSNLALAGGYRHAPGHRNRGLRAYWDH